jgi:hypothetical protein
MGDPKVAEGRTGTRGFSDTALTQKVGPGAYPAPSSRSDMYSFAALVCAQLTNGVPSVNDPAGSARALLSGLRYPVDLVELVSRSLTFPIGRPEMAATTFLDRVLDALHAMSDQRWIVPGAASPRRSEAALMASTA